METFAYTNTEEEIWNSSSGGAFIELCKTFERIYGAENVAFCGAELLQDMSVRHSVVFSAEDSHRFQGSKYVKSQTAGIYNEIEELLRKGMAVLFSGTPCQVAAINKYLDTRKVSKDNFLSIDIICHGTPDVKVWNTYKSWLQNIFKSRLVEYSFRYKKAGWMGYPAYAKFENGKELIDTKETSVYSKLHLLGYSVTRKCFDCPFANMERKGDITLGDFWGVENEGLNIEIMNGVSLVLANSSVGQKFVSAMRGNKISVSSGSFLKYQHNLSRPTEMPEHYNEFWNDIQTQPFDTVLNKYLKYSTIYTLRHSAKKAANTMGILGCYRKLKVKFK